jgi:hypothetical protein
VHKYWPFFIDKARELLRSCDDKHQFSVTDLVFGWWDSSTDVEVCHNSLFFSVTGIGCDYRYGNYNFNLKKAINHIIPPVQLIEYTNAGLNDERWAKWIVDESRDGIVSTFQRWGFYGHCHTFSLTLGFLHPIDMLNISNLFSLKTEMSQDREIECMRQNGMRQL